MVMVQSSISRRSIFIIASSLLIFLFFVKSRDSFTAFFLPKTNTLLGREIEVNSTSTQPVLTNTQTFPAVHGPGETRGDVNLKPSLPSAFRGSNHTETLSNETDFEGGRCDFYNGQWELDTDLPMYEGKKCKWLSEHWACRRGKNSTFEYEKYRWRPRRCSPPTFDRTQLLNLFRNQTITFVGDSLGRQQFQSFLCLVDPDLDHPLETEDVGKEEFGFHVPRGRRGPTGLANLFTEFNLTVVFFGTEVLCETETLDSYVDKKTNKTKSRVALHVDRIDPALEGLLARSDVFVLNSHHHWNGGKKHQNGWIIYSGNEPRPRPLHLPEMQLSNAICVNHAVGWATKRAEEIAQQRGKKPLVFFRSFSPRHFKNGDWNTGGTCNDVQFGENTTRNMVDEAAISATESHKSAILLNISQLSDLRGDTHLADWDLYGTRRGMDCLHWCLPGVPDTWNEIMYWETAMRKGKP